jgi:hypothetical protein
MVHDQGMTVRQTAVARGIDESPVRWLLEHG